VVATFSVYFDWGGADNAPGNNTDIDALGPPTLRFKDADDATIDANNKLVIPGAGTKYSYIKHIYLYCDAPDGHTINNVGIYTDGGAPIANMDVKIGDEQPTKNSGSDAGYDVSIADSEMSAQHTDITGVTSFFAYTAGEGTDFDVSISEAGNIINLATETSDYVVLQMTVDAAANPGDIADETGTWSYDEA
jgi:hypothetical protein